jgi:NAD(P) transhydrogenase subunit beta
MGALSAETLLGFLTTTASLIAFGKLQEILPTRPLTYRGQNFVSLIVLGGAVVLAAAMVAGVSDPWVFPTFVGCSLMFGILLVTPIGGADMPTVIALLNSSCARP